LQALQGHSQSICTTLTATVSISLAPGESVMVKGARPLTTPLPPGYSSSVVGALTIVSTPSSDARQTTLERKSRGWSGGGDAFTE
jgi:hypothetical protein